MIILVQLLEDQVGLEMLVHFCAAVISSGNDLSFVGNDVELNRKNVKGQII